jgi:hypothetical protein
MPFTSDAVLRQRSFDLGITTLFVQGDLGIEVHAISAYFLGAFDNMLGGVSEAIAGADQ